MNYKAFYESRSTENMEHYIIEIQLSLTYWQWLKIYQTSLMIIKMIELIQ
jgi:hypothetical protein